MLEIKNVSFRLAGNLIFSLANAYIPSGSKVGIVGRNGTGKTTLFKLIKNEYSAESGEIKVKKDAQVGGVSQDVPNGCESLISTVIGADLELKALRSDERSAEDAARIAEIHEKILDLDGYSAEARASSILHGLGFNNEEQKSGINLKNFSDFFSVCNNDLKLHIVGIMCIPPMNLDASIYFKKMQELKKRFNLQNLSMGMSSDYLSAVEFESNFVRIGTKIFGYRN